MTAERDRLATALSFALTQDAMGKIDTDATADRLIAAGVTFPEPPRHAVRVVGIDSEGALIVRDEWGRETHEDG